MLATDPVQRYYNAPAGAIYEIKSSYVGLTPETRYRRVAAR